MTFIVRGQDDVAALSRAAHRAVRSVDPVVPLEGEATLGSLVRASTATTRVEAWILSSIAAIAVLLAALGVYGVLAHAVVERSTEIGIRLALGAMVPSILGMLILDGMRPAMIGTVLGLAGGLAAGRLIHSLLFGISPLDLTTYFLAVAVVLIVSLCASALPAFRGVRSDIARALQQH